MQAVGSSGVLQTVEEYRTRIAEREQERGEAKKLQEARRIMRTRLVNWAAWYRREHISEIDHDTGHKKTNMIGRIMSVSSRFLSDDALTEIDEEDAIAVYEAMKTLEDADHVAIIQYRFIDCYSVEKIAKEWGRSQKTVKRCQSDAVDSLRAAL